MPEPAQVTFKLNLSERLQVFSRQKNWENFKAIFVGRKVTTADPMVSLLIQKSTKGSTTVSDPSEETKALLDRKTTTFETGLAIHLPGNDKKHWQANRPEEAKPLGGRHGMTLPDQALTLVQLGKLRALDAMLARLDPENPDDETEYLHIRNHLLLGGVMYSFVDIAGKRHQGAEAVLRKHSQRFDGPRTRELKQMAEDKVSVTPHLEQHFNDRESFETLRDDLYNEGFFSLPLMREDIMLHSTTFDEKPVITAKEYLLDGNIQKFREHVKDNFADSHAIADLIQNLDDNGFLFTETMTLITEAMTLNRPRSSLKQARPIKTFLNELYAKLSKQEALEEKQAALNSHSDDQIRRWLSANTPDRDEMEQLMNEINSTDRYSQEARQIIEADYRKQAKEQLHTPLWAAEAALSDEALVKVNYDQYIDLLKTSEQSRSDELKLQKMENRIISNSAALKKLRAQLTEGQKSEGDKGTLQIQTVPASHQEIEHMIRLVENPERDGFDPVTANITAVCLEEIKNNYEEQMLDYLRGLLRFKDQQGINQFLELLPSDDLKDNLKARLDL